MRPWSVPRTLPTQVLYDEVVLDPPPIRCGEEIWVPAREFGVVAPGSGYIPLSQVVPAGSKTSPEDNGEVIRVPLWGSGSQRDSHYRYYPVYQINAQLDPEKRVIKGHLTLAYQNPYFYPLYDLLFNLPSNGWPGGENSLTIQEVTLNNEPASFRIKGSRLEVSLRQALTSGETLKAEISFTTYLPERPDRLGVWEDIFVVSGWYPILSPRGGGTWCGMAGGLVWGEPYFSDSAYYNIELELPSFLTVLASARSTGTDQRGNQVLWTFTSEKPIREFAFVLGKGWEKASVQVDHTLITMAFRERVVPSFLDTAVRAFKFFKDYWGPYPYSYLNLVEAPLRNFYGMEYPGLILLSTYRGYTPTVIIHEVAHQWWYNLVGNDSLRAPWIDEGLAEYSTLLYYRTYEPELYERLKVNIIAEAGERLSLEELSELLNREFTDFASEKDYRRAAYRQGAVYWLKMEEKMGVKALQEALRYIQEYYRFERLEPRWLENILEFYSHHHKKE
ncbi:MAG: hypothetical protein L5656_05275 [Thermanaeromonas sp.]|nr:hypothetical protein [Thermanaeromonas sp.]